MFLSSIWGKLRNPNMAIFEIIDFKKEVQPILK
jgi:hypothetical protein